MVSTAPSPAASPARRSRLHPARIALGLLALLVVIVAVSEWAGWPYLAGPMQSALSDVLKRPVRLYEQADAQTQANDQSGLQPAAAGTQRADGVSIHLLGGVDIRAARIDIGAPSWSEGPPTLMASNARIQLRYRDLWRASRGEQVVVRRIEADRLELALERDARGRASWQFGEPKPEQAERDTPLPVIEALLVRAGRLDLKDAQLDSLVNAKFSLVEGIDGASGAGAGAKGADQAGASADARIPIGLQVVADGRYRALPIKLEARSSGAMGWVGEGSMPIRLRGSVGHAQVRFDGALRGVPSLAAANGSFFLSGRSLAAVGDVIGVTLPTTPAFTVRGSLDKQGAVWSTRIDDARIGNSQLNAALRYDADARPGLLEGRVGGSRLLLQDLGPAIGTTPEVDVANPVKRVSTRPAGRVLPAREFDLPSLRAMNANILLSFDELDLGTGRLEPLAPMRAHLVLQDAVLTIQDIDARAASGSLAGMLSLDGRKPEALWHSDLRWQNVRLEKWLNIQRKDGSPPYISGRLDGRARLDGHGKSTAQILASLNGTLRARVRDGAVSHLLVEGAGLDIAQALGVWIKGDEPLPMSCALTELKVANGVMKPEVMVVDTRDSVIWVDGAISLVDESLNLRAVTSPKDFSPLALRTPVLVGGTMASPAVSLSSKPLAGKVIAAGLLSLLNPLAALIPLIDTGTADDTASGCAALLSKAEARKQSAKS